jgi:acyl-lipid omega-6 desaturase (Delta-12 desaturase)
MWRSLAISYWITLAIAVLAAGFMVRIFIIFHDCGHGSFFASRQANAIVGTITGIITFTPYHQWRYDHAVHHATAGDLDRRGVGDVWTLTVAEYRSSPLRVRLSYRLFRHPLVMLGLGGIGIFGLRQRFPSGTGGRRERMSVYGTDLALAAIWLLAGMTMGLRAFLQIQLPILILGTAGGIWLFYVQHQFRGVRWSRHDSWNYYQAAIEGASFYRLPKVLQWFTGNIGFHHVHHLSPRIPNYLLEECHNAVPELREQPALTLAGSLSSLSLRLWDEENQRLVGFAEAGG